MAKLIPPSFIDELLGRTVIVELIGKRLSLRRVGHNFSALCPFHSEKTPSFTVSQEKQFYYCFGCGAHGSAIGFLMAYDRLSFPEAVEELAEHAAIPLPPETQNALRPQQPEPSLYEVLAAAAKFYSDQLRHHPQAARAVNYLKKRGLTGAVAAQYDLGYAPPGWHNLLNQLGSNTHQRKIMQTAGLLADKGGNHYDRFRDRIMFPITDSRKRVIAFGGRALGDEEPKYLNSPETPLFQKGRELYGLNQARDHYRVLPRLILVEGYMDVLALSQFGIHNVVATLGTATTREHLERLFRHTPRLLFCFDGDEAGRNAARKAMHLVLPFLRDGRQVDFRFLPEGEDPDSFVRRLGADALTHEADNVPLSRYLFDDLLRQVDISTLDGRARLVELAKPLLEQIPHGAYRDLITARLAELSGLSERKLQGAPGKPPPAPRRRAHKNPSLVRKAITLLLTEPQMASKIEIPDALLTLQQAGIPLLVELLEIARAQPDINSARLVERYRDRPEYGTLAQLAASEPMVPAGMTEPEFLGTMEKLVQQAIKREKAATVPDSPRDLTDRQRAEFRARPREGSTSELWK